MKTLKDQLIEKGLAQSSLQIKEKLNTTTRDKQVGRLTRRELAELMGVNRDTFKRVGGAIRRR